MRNQKFNSAIQSQIDISSDLLFAKNSAYNEDGDRLGNFKTAAALAGHKDPKKALGGMMAKHTVSVYDMINSNFDYPVEVWTEKITDHINYLLLLKAMVVEESSFFEDVDGDLEAIRKKLAGEDETPNTLNEAVEELLTGPDWQSDGTKPTSPFSKARPEGARLINPGDAFPTIQIDKPLPR